MNKIILSWFLLFIAFSVFGQENDIPSATDCYYIQNATVVVKPGLTKANTSIILRNGIIKDIGVNLAIPYDAKVIKADSMFVYAGFIDAFSTAGIEKSDDKSKDKENKPSSPGVATLEQAGITPQIHALDLINPKDKSIEGLRNSGFVIAHVVPDGYIIPGQGCLISLKDAPHREDLVLKKDISMTASFKTKRGVFPSTFIGAMSRLREIDRNTEIYLKNRNNYKVNPVGLQRPSFVKEYESFSTVVEKKIPLFFKAEKPKNIHRVMTLKDEMDFDLVLTNVELITPILDVVHSDIPVLLSLKLPKEPKSSKGSKESSETKDPKKTEGKADQKEKPKEEKLTEEQIELKKRIDETYDLYLNQAKLLSEKNRTIAFSTESVPSGDILKNIKRLIKAGLSEDQALAALTTTPAKIFKIDHIAGTVEKGKLGSMVIADKSIFDEKAVIKYVIVEGQVHKKEEAKKSNKKSNGSLGNIVGAWRFEAEVPEETQYGNIFIEKEGDDYKVGVESDDEPGEITQATEVTVEGNELSFNILLQDNDPPMEVGFRLSFINEDRLEGTISVANFGTFPITADKRDRPD